MNSLQYYRELYHDNEDDVIGDPHEGQLCFSDSEMIIQSQNGGRVYFEHLHDK